MLKNYIRKFSPRSWSNDQLKIVSSWLPSGAKIINVSGWEDRDKEGAHYKNYFTNPSQYHISNHPDDKARGSNVHSDWQIDLDKELPQQLIGAYDIAFSHTVLEHVPNPVFSFAQISKITSDLIITVVPFKQKLHFEDNYYGDYYRFSPMAMRKLHSDNGFTVLFEGYTPSPSLDIYLFYVGTKQPDRYANVIRQVPEIGKLNQLVGNFNAATLIKNACVRLLTKLMRKAGIK